ncbi:MAG: hypothetical protein HKN52_00305 [Eudoraea sp.]|nr:hypothetical protein [Muriicola sp.]NNE01579.1 hypothetical protein [Eudoraea sp.]NNL03207.1 hypothetical protein [Eudoraea sp.]
MKAKRKMVMILLFSGAFALLSCGPVIVSSRLDTPPPPWFYPNRLELVRYVYFPEYSIYYDITASTYIYWDINSWVRVTVLPPRYRHINFNRSRYVRVRNYRDDNIARYHDQYRANRGRSNRTTPKRNN